MDKIVIQGGLPLKGRIKISGSKNAALPLMAASLLTDSKLILSHVPSLMDIQTMMRLLKVLGIHSSMMFGRLALQAKGRRGHEAPYDIVRKMRASILVLGPLLAKLGKARVSLPGGCAIGARPINLHLKALEAMGAKIKLEEGYVNAVCPRLKGARIVFDDVTVTGTENIMMAAVLAKGRTILENAALEPEVTDLADLLNHMGAKIAGVGTSTIEIEGVDDLGGASHTVIPDRIEAGTFMIAAAMTRGDVILEGLNPSHVDALTQKLRDAGATIESNGSRLRLIGPREIKPVDVKTAPFPGFATDFQAQFTALMSVANGQSTITETIFENRFMHVPELNRMGAQLEVKGNMVVIKGVERLQSAPIMASDLRASASLVLAGLVAKGVTDIHRVYHIDRGYESIEKKLRRLGAKVKRAKVRY
ncbi:MAG: UDP-N-acetylglucosamine 1-carboxyvinyltransferase [Deltaproteobacteria bacterium]|nr:UDP-N-acetylglucosamine 1-carboxyvinyltransferase [Deltaproteobacteria bacterium]